MLTLASAPPLVAQTPEALAVHWKSLASDDAEKAYTAMRRLAETPKEAIAFLRGVEAPAKAVDPKAIDELIQQLSSKSFTAREKAYQELERLDRHAVPPLQRALESPIELETKRRVDALLARQDVRLPGSLARVRRVMELLHWIGTPEARELLSHWGQGADAARLTQEARTALKRWPTRTDPVVDPKSPRVDSAGDPLPPGAVLRLGSTRWRMGDHSLARGTLHFTPDNRQLIVCDSESFRLVNVHDGKTTVHIPFGANIRGALLTPNQKHLVVTGDSRKEDGAVELLLAVWDWKSGKRVNQWRVDGSILGFAANGDAVLGFDAGIRRFDIKAGKEVGIHPAAEGVNFKDAIENRYGQIALNDKLIVVTAQGSDKAAIYDWSASGEAKTLRFPFERSRRPVLALSPSNKLLAHADGDISPLMQGVTLFDAATWQPIRQIVRKDSAGISYLRHESIVFSPDGKSLAFGSSDYRGYEDDPGNIVIWDLENHRVRAKTSRTAANLTFSADSRLIAGFVGPRVFVWDAETGKNLTAPEDAPFGSSYNLGLGFLPNGRALFVPHPNYVALWEFPSGNMMARIEHRHARQIAASRDSRLIATASYLEGVHMWNVADGKNRHKLPLSKNLNYHGLAFSSNGDRLSVWGDDFVLRGWDVKTGRLVTELRPRPENFPKFDDGDEESVRALAMASRTAFSSDGARMLWNFQGVQQFDVATGAPLGTIETGFDFLIQVSTTEGLDWLLMNAYRDGRMVVLINLPERKIVAEVRLPNTREFIHAVLSPDGRVFAVANQRPHRALDLYETATLQRRASIQLSGGVINQIAFSPSSRYLAAEHSDGTTLIFDVREFGGQTP